MFFSVILISVLSVTTIGFPRNWQVDMVCVCVRMKFGGGKDFT